ncbi:DUF5908 family protein [Pedobacter sp. KR3-3]|uniref:DUF5908 family protein n=1 Tax=Pedobacter albus TaxID=3113905 RepID=A0ABU7I4W7_9SPHI|nr:DUF5908 family protein [Pedobacter sp. KR3-3]MEE1944510.1 DUF5908 family protein [Pedobacter sp. KR3-3]
MPIEIRELVIKTEIVANGQNNQQTMRGKELQLLKRQLMAEVKRLMAMQQSNNLYNR